MTTEQLIEDAGARIVRKRDSRLMRFIAMFAGGEHGAFMVNYLTTLGRTIYLPSVVYQSTYDIAIRHELVHIAQWKRWNVWLWISYALLPIPAGLAWFRWAWEREAYLQADILPFPDAEARIEFVVQALHKHYLCPWPRKWMRAWFFKRVAEARITEEETQ